MGSIFLQPEAVFGVGDVNDLIFRFIEHRVFLGAQHTTNTPKIFSSGGEEPFFYMPAVFGLFPPNTVVFGHVCGIELKVLQVKEKDAMQMVGGEKQQVFFLRPVQLFVGIHDTIAFYGVVESQPFFRLDTESIDTVRRLKNFGVVSLRRRNLHALRGEFVEIYHLRSAFSSLAVISILVSGVLSPCPVRWSTPWMRIRSSSFSKEVPTISALERTVSSEMKMSPLRVDGVE